MVAVRALQRRVVKLEQARKPRPSPFVRWYGSFDAFVVPAIWPGIRAGTLSEGDMLDIVEALRCWEGDGTWGGAH
jgi:hypothetical protein